MPPKDQRKQDGGGGSKRGPKKAHTTGPKKKREVTFDPKARREYLRGFSERKKQRRAYGLAMQKVKDRKAKLQERRETKQADLERIEEAEEQKKDLLQDGDSADESGEDTMEDANTLTTTYQDVATQSQFGGQVIVTTTTMPPSDDESDGEDQAPPSKKKNAVDAQQRYAGNVNRFMNQFKGKMPGKKKKDGGPKHKGRHGAASMKGMGGAANLKLAQKALSNTIQTKGRNPGNDSKKKHGGKRKR